MKAVTKTITKSKIEYFVGLDLHKEFMQVAVMDDTGNLLWNRKVDCKHSIVKKEFSKIPQNAKYVMESSSVWYGMYKFLTNEMKLDVVLSHPYANRVIAQSKKKTDKVDALVLADLLRGGYIALSYVPSQTVVERRELVRYRYGLVKERTRFKNKIHSVLLQKGIKIKSSPFTAPFNNELRNIGDWRIDEYLKTIEFLNDRIAQANIKIHQEVKQDKNAQLLTTIPGISDYTALVLSSEIDDITRFHSPDHLLSYFGIIPSVRNSANTVHYGGITKQGNSLVRHVLGESAIIYVKVMKKRNPEDNINEFYNRIKKRRGHSKAKVATAAKLANRVFWMLTKQIDFETCIIEGKKHSAQKGVNYD